MKFAASLMGVRLQSLGDAAKALEDHGFESVWVPEHVALPAQPPNTYPYTGDGAPPIPPRTPCYDPFVLLSFVASATSTIRLGTNVYILPLHHPLRTARGTATLDRLSGGRVTLGVGAGWLRDEFDWLGEDFGNRGHRTDEIIGLLRQLWGGDLVDSQSSSYRFGPVQFEPRPVQPGGIPIEVGGTSRAALRRAAHLGDGWIEIGSTDLPTIAQHIAVLHALRADVGREDAPFEVTVGHLWASDADTVRRAADVGVTRIMARPFQGVPLDAAGVGEWAQRFRDNVIEPMSRT